MGDGRDRAHWNHTASLLLFMAAASGAKTTIDKLHPYMESDDKGGDVIDAGTEDGRLLMRREFTKGRIRKEKRK